jgi:antitoxin (DNA-binding transcriptional repressor) of toxin-antitoxin stability system
LTGLIGAGYAHAVRSPSSGQTLMDTLLDKCVDASEFEAHCSTFLDKLDNGTLHRLEVTRDGIVVAVLTPPDRSLFGLLRGTVSIPDGFDLTKPVFEGPMHADEGRVHE